MTYYKTCYRVRRGGVEWQIQPLASPHADYAIPGTVFTHTSQVSSVLTGILHCIASVGRISSSVGAKMKCVQPNRGDSK